MSAYIYCSAIVAAFSVAIYALPSLSAAFLGQLAYFWAWTCFGLLILLGQGLQAKLTIADSLLSTDAELHRLRHQIPTLKEKVTDLTACFGTAAEEEARLATIANENQFKIDDLLLARAARDNELATLKKELDVVTTASRAQLAALADLKRTNAIYMDEIDSLEWDKQLVKRLTSLGLEAPGYLSPPETPRSCASSDLPLYSPPLVAVSPRPSLKSRFSSRWIKVLKVRN